MEDTSKRSARRPRQVFYRGIELLVVDRDDVDVREVLPFHAVEVVPADAVGDERGDFHFELVTARLQGTRRNVECVWRQDAAAEIHAVEPHARRFAYVAEVELRDRVRRGVEGGCVAHRAAERRIEGRPCDEGCEIGGGRECGAAADGREAPGADHQCVLEAARRRFSQR